MRIGLRKRCKNARSLYSYQSYLLRYKNWDLPEKAEALARDLSPKDSREKYILEEGRIGFAGLARK